MQYQKKSQQIEATQVTLENVEEIATLVGGFAHVDHIDICYGTWANSFTTIHEGDYVWVLGNNFGYFSQSDFERDYEPVEQPEEPGDEPETPVDEPEQPTDPEVPEEPETPTETPDEQPQ